ncbi:MAG: 2OG-Fe(II) oxygenase [Acidiferrobacterales bacterium]|nr:2OG-Fe(II) oxygenase [Acidiferrobacterales bacterium]
MNKVFSDFINYPGKPGLKDFYEKQNFLTPEELTTIESYFDKLEMEAGATRSEQGKKNVANNSYRTSRVGWIPKQDAYRWLYQRMGELVNEANSTLWNFDLFGMAEPIQLTEYHAEEEGHYDWHTDVGAGRTSLRKLSITIQISPPTDYQGGELQFMSRRLPQTAEKIAGAAYVFPSYLLHRVKPVSQGMRRSIVVWVSGPPFR